jgi:hypothetical protein
LVSPVIEIRYSTKAGSSANAHHTRVCASTICEVDIDPDTMNTLTRDIPMASS